ncbi:MAG TPA: ATP-binding cassette domain-containing protein, partial [Azospirillaceae bacterium]|nr:ATP-binding cassette domain-containing protein [Azospirillaceae bacterium]
MLSIQNVAKRYPNGTLALDRLSLSVEQSEILALVGGSGCGKSTLLRLISGLDHPTGGTIDLDGAPVRQPRAEIGVVFQEPRLMPWLTIDQNVAFGIRHLPAAEQKKRVVEALARVGLAAYGGHWPRALSGG